MEFSTRNSLLATVFHVSDTWQVHEPWMAGISEEPAGLFIRLSPKVPELEPGHLLLGAQLVLGSGVALPSYTLWKREESGHLVFFFAGEQADDAWLNAQVRLIERS